MTVDDLVFERADCCAAHNTATVLLEEGRSLGIQKSEDGTVFSVTVYQDGALDCRHPLMDAGSLNALLETVS